MLGNTDVVSIMANLAAALLHGGSSPSRTLAISYSHLQFSRYCLGSRCMTIVRATLTRLIRTSIEQESGALTQCPAMANFS